MYCKTIPSDISATKTKLLMLQRNYFYKRKINFVSVWFVKIQECNKKHLFVVVKSFHNKPKSVQATPCSKSSELLNCF